MKYRGPLFAFMELMGDKQVTEKSGLWVGGDKLDIVGAGRGPGAGWAVQSGKASWSKLTGVVSRNKWLVVRDGLWMESWVMDGAPSCIKAGDRGVRAYSKPEEASCAKEKTAGGTAEVGEVRGLEERR